ncbi:hypothetical protein JKP88DRAFT_289437 [Tribonema minus]|uniref:BRCT domain-containing protein n=1 Tax=Tribonema minus TaxID=303371 RepID=A0A836CHA0_9STRA|nr:hypothetical protein JKP88DRAFT_289437 [Tribonema minus]
MARHSDIRRAGETLGGEYYYGGVLQSIYKRTPLGGARQVRHRDLRRRELLRSASGAVESLGGEYSPGLTHATTHLLSRAAAGDMYAIATSRPAAIAIATPDWALRCAAARARLPAADFALPPFAGVHACCSGPPAARRAAVKC